MTKNFSSKIRNKAYIPIPTISFQHIAVEILARTSRERKREREWKKEKEYANQRGTAKIICSQMTWFYMWKTQCSTKNLLGLIGEFNTLVGYKSTYKKISNISYVNSKLSEGEIKKKIPFIIASRRIKYLGINPSKEVKDLYIEIYIALMKEIRCKWKDTQVHGLERFTLLKLSYYPKLYVGSTLLLLLTHFSHVRLGATPQTAAHQAPPSLRFSRQGHWSGLPFPSPMHESEKWKWSHSVMSDS